MTNKGVREDAEKYCKEILPRLEDEGMLGTMVTAIAHALRRDREERSEEIRRLKAWVNDLQSGMYINCVYCGHQYGPKEDTPISMADVLKEHVEQCPEHPMSRLKAENEALKRDTLGAKLERLARKQIHTHEGPFYWRYFDCSLTFYVQPFPGRYDDPDEAVDKALEEMEK